MTPRSKIVRRYTLWATVLMIFFLTTSGLTETGSGEALLIRLSTESTTLHGEKLKVSLLLRAIGRKGDVNVIVDEGIDDTISLNLEDVYLDNLFRIIMETKGLRYYESNGALIVEKAADFKKQQRDVITVRVCPGYGDAEGHLTELDVLKSEDGSINVTADGNCLVVRDHEENVKKIGKLLKALDRPIPQVHIKARIVTMAKSLSRELGIKWGYTDLSNLPQDSFSAATDLSVVDPTTELIFGFIRDTYNLDIELSALQERKELELLSEPRVVVLDGHEAEIKQGKEIPYDSGTKENRSTTFREAVLSLKVIPKILQNGFIKLDVKVTNDSVDEASTEEGQPLLNRQEIMTNLFLEDGVTVVIGGILMKDTNERNSEVPWLVNLPIVGNLFKSVDELDETYELLVFLTPTIIKGRPGFTFASDAVTIMDTEEGAAAEKTSAHSGLSDVMESTDGRKMLLHPIEMRDKI